MKNPEDFQLESSFGSISLGSGERLLEALSRNQKLQRLSLDRMNFEDNFWRLCTQYIEREVGMVSREAPLASKLELLRGFKNLKRLSFRRCRYAVDDEVIQLIFREMTSIQEQEFSQCPDFTDAGLTGFGPEE